MSDCKLDGFTLLEVMVALVILSVAFAAVIFSINTNTGTLIHVQQTTGANWVASNVMAEAELGLLENSTSGFEEQLNRRYYWEINTQSTQNPDVRKIDIKVGLSRQGSSIVTLQGYLGAPVG